MKTSYTLPEFFPIVEDQMFTLELLGKGLASIYAFDCQPRPLASDDLGRIIGAAYKLDQDKVYDDDLKEDPAKRSANIAYAILTTYYAIRNESEISWKDIESSFNFAFGAVPELEKDTQNVFNELKSKLEQNNDFTLS